MLPIGTIVMPNVKSNYYRTFKDQYTDDYNNNYEGEVIGSAHCADWSKVKWTNGHKNTYPDDLLTICEENKEVNNMYETPFLPGQRVCLNPEGYRYSVLNEHIKGKAGYVVSINMHEEEFKDWNVRNNKQNITVQVKFDNNFIYYLKYKELLLIDSPYKDVEQYELSNGGTYFVIDNQTNKELEETIIILGRTITNKVVYDDAFRERVMKKIKNNVSEDLF